MPIGPTIMSQLRQLYNMAFSPVAASAPAFIMAAVARELVPAAIIVTSILGLDLFDDIFADAAALTVNKYHAIHLCKCC